MEDTVRTTNPREEEFQLLKERADMLGIKYSGNIGLETLRAKVNEKLEASNIKKEAKDAKVALRKKIQDEELKLVRIRLTLMNPAKKAWRGEIFTTANSIIGTVKKFVPYNPKFYTNGYHVPYCIYKMLRDKQFMNIVTEEHGAQTEVHTDLVKEFSIEVLPDLTKEELQDLAVAQQAGNRIDQN